MPSVMAFAALIAWPVVVFVLVRSMPPAKALLGAILGGYLLLPFGVGFDLPLLPFLDKTSIPALSFLVFYFFRQPDSLQRPRLVPAEATDGMASDSPLPGPARGAGTRPRQRGSRIELMLLTALLVGPAITVLQNGEPLVFGRTFLPGLTYYDLLSMLQTAFIGILPYLLARQIFQRPEDHVLLLKGIVLSALLYSILALVEIRLSPQISTWVYGFLAQNFGQAVRDGGFRPVVFLQHGLWLAIFFAMALTTAFALWRQVKVTKWLAAGVWLLLILALSRSLGALLLALAAVPIVLFLKPRTQILLTGAVALVIILYPALRGAGLIPVESLASWADSVNTQRGESLSFRFDNEDQLLARANEKPLAGWGTWGRGRIYNAEGVDISITDGIWIIFIGDGGWLGYIANFGLLTLPLFLLVVRRKSSVVTPAIAGLGVALCVNLVDMIPNATLTPVTWVIAGALMGALRAVPVVDKQVAAQQPSVRRPLTYSRAR